ncbi:adipolin-like [Babylonia areolata]|uniref:adipolin-like n=1 Tax=Babylonia areolata TaxID=304850 RepID=UPI003FD046A0
MCVWFDNKQTQPNRIYTSNNATTPAMTRRYDVTVGVTLLVVVVLVGNVTSYRDDFLPSQDEDVMENLSTNQEERPARLSIDPKGSWLSFVEHSERTNTRRQPKRKKKRRNKEAMLHGPPGPQGPRGPPGPRGAPGAQITKEDLMTEFKSLVKDMAEKRAERLVTERCEACTSLLNGSYSLPPEVDQMLLIPRVSAAFHMRLSRNFNVAPSSFVELKNFYQPFGGGAFQRGHLFKSRDGRFLAPRDGLYQFTAHLHIKLRHKGARGSPHKRLRKRDYVKVQICIDSLCEKNMSLNYISGLETNSRVFTVSVGGLLELKKKQYASVYMDNASRMTVKVMNGSDFTGILFGV